ncbi:MAG: site-specific DNA-methyltransferase [Anaerolineae bacterium]|jgi:REP element-mobilizing transposase RayT/16S rRNA G966 N2-methylase RsmD|nr:MAG: site-specific DNA-methyltransferase [Anaerolineae bacterium]
MTQTSIEKFQSLLRELFQFDCADLDFGIYRIMNHKRAVIEQFIAQDLPKAIAEELARGALAEQSQAAQELQAAKRKVLDALGEEALDADGRLKDAFHNTPAGKAYVEAQAKAAGSRSTEALETAIYNHLYTFFSRYWQDGDIISKRRYSKKERYAIPYNGEEVYLYWANHDQYYVKSGEYFTDYTYQAPNGVTVHFKLRQADVEQNNVKGEKRFFLLRLDEIAWDEGSPLLPGEGLGVRGTLTIPFEFRPLTAQETITYGQKNQQEAIIAKAVDEIPKRVKAPEALAALTAERRQSGNAGVSSASFASSALGHHLRQYTRRNTSDFFIHKDLRGFLSRELDFYLKNEVLNLEEMEAAGEGLTEGWFQLVRLIKRIGLAIIEFLAQIEDFQKMLWEKKKFLTETFYVVTVGNIPEAFYPEIAACEAQWEEWKKLGLIPEENGRDVRNPGISDVPSVPSAVRGWHSRGYLPHFDASNICQFITFRLHDSVPAPVIERWKQELHWHEGLSADSKEAVELRKRIEKYADSGKGACYLRDERIARLVQDALKHFDGERYRLIAWCIMPNHVHVLIEMMDVSLSDIVQSWKSYTAHQANKLLGRSGTFWGPDYFDRYIRDEKHFNATVEYILQNPVKAGLVDTPEKWPWAGYTGNANVTGNADAPSAPNRPNGRDIRDPRVAFLQAHPTLPLDTRHFSPEFVDRLVASFENLDELTDGLLVHSENWQALNLLQEKYRERVKCIYIDPPYNTAASEILYKNNYKHSSWLALMENRLRLGQGVLTNNGVGIVAIDDTEKTVLSQLITFLFPNHDQNVVVNHHPAGAGLEGANISTTHEYAIFIPPAGQKVLYGPKTVAGESRIAFIRTGTAESNLRKGRPNSFYAVLVNPVTSQVVGAEPPPRGGQYPRGATQDGLLRIYPVSEDGTERVWRRSYESFFEELSQGNIECVNNKTLYLKSDPTDRHKPIFSNWTDTRYNAGAHGTNLLTNIIGVPLFSYPKSLYTVVDCISAVTVRSPDASILDFFAGSGTTGHAVINLNREDGGRRKFILVEMAHYFDTVLLPRIKKVTFTPEWKDGKPKRMATAEEAKRSPRIVKVIRLESYEDALNNLTFDEQSGQQALKFEDYLLSYMLRWETRHSETLLNVEQLQSPFSYKLHLHRNGETRVRPVDLPETFAYLLGLDVQTRKVYLSRRDACDPGEAGNAGVSTADRYLVYHGALRNGRTVAVIWRKTQGWTAEDYERDAAFVAEQELTAGADEIYVNGDSRIPGARSLDPIFKERMFAGVEAQV